MKIYPKKSYNAFSISDKPLYCETCNLWKMYSKNLLNEFISNMSLFKKKGEQKPILIDNVSFNLDNQYKLHKI